MGVFLSKSDFFRRFAISLGTHKGQLCLLAADGYARLIFQERKMIMQTARETLYKFSVQDNTYETVSYDDPLLSFSIPPPGYIRVDKSVMYVTPMASTSTSSSIGYIDYSIGWSQDKYEPSASISLDSITSRKGVIESLLGKTDKLSAPHKTLILSPRYCLSRVGFGEQALILGARGSIIGNFDFKAKQAKIFSGPAAEIHRKRIKELINVADSG